MTEGMQLRGANCQHFHMKTDECNTSIEHLCSRGHPRPLHEARGLVKGDIECRTSLTAQSPDAIAGHGGQQFRLAPRQRHVWEQLKNLQGVGVIFFQLTNVFGSLRYPAMKNPGPS